MGYLARMQPGVDGHDAEASGPARQHEFQHLGTIFHPQHDAIAVIAAILAKRTRNTADALRQAAIGPHDIALGDSRITGLSSRDLEKKRCEVDHVSYP